MNERIRSIVNFSIGVMWILPTVLISAAGTDESYLLPGRQDPGIGLIQSYGAAIYTMVNEERRKRDLPELAWATDIAEVARRHSEDMAVNGYFSHVNQEEETVETRLIKAGIVFTASSENLFTSNDFLEIADESVRRWMESPGHRDNLLNAHITDTGVGIYKDSEGNNYFITQVFIQRALKIVPSPSRLSRREVDTIFDMIKAVIDKSTHDYDPSSVKKRILKELTHTGIPVKENLYIEGRLKDIPVLGMTIAIIAGDGFIVNFMEGDPEAVLETYSGLVHPQGYSAAVLISEIDGEVRFPLIKIQ